MAQIDTRLFKKLVSHQPFKDLRSEPLIAFTWTVNRWLASFNDETPLH